MTGPPLVSVILPTYARAELLEEAIASVVAQTVEDWECIVVDDASPEPVSLAIARRDPRVRLVRRQENGGPAAARNTGLREARGSFVAFLDDDDLYTRDRLALGLEGVDRAAVAVCWVAFVHGPVTEGRRLEGDVSDTILDDLTPSLGAATLAREAAPEFDETLDNLEDLDWWLRTAQAHRVTTVPRVGYLFRRHAGPRHRTDAASRVADNLRFLEREREYFARHPRAAAVRWKRVGLLAEAVGDRRQARRAYLRSLRRRPSAATIGHLIRSLTPAVGPVPRL